MTTIYRSPPVIIDRHEWYVAVERRSTQYGRRSFRRFRFRALGSNDAFRSIDAWVGPKPKAMWRSFRPFLKHVEAALAAEVAKAAAVAEWDRRDATRRVVA
jgi:hypothetical protein